ncbi:2-amino-4-hydroxy-6-hydroxymethyldihydropteridine diphosphokinase [Paracoccus luteus]|uniref:2-amino-4-hydroxy-6- hydroxymethyldihydropteridine diphosphokinase n=1 Tax=Paracoccus luteus TaxID=2508543 RepID=UPI00106F6082|nr:2-amino-4-hydroxy-6-hydroxymethyldihydropteridine diphosphokinase [Paracoccus luteus]
MRAVSDSLALLALGANLSSSAGSPADALRAALARISALRGVRLVAVSRFWRTPAHPAGSGPDYVNACAAARVGPPAAALLAQLHGIEAAMGRERTTRWAARGIDIDLLAMDDAVAPDAAVQDRWRALPPAEQARAVPGQLILPHPRIQDRAFVLAPLAEIAPRWTHPRTGRDAAAMLAALGPAALAGMHPLP